jgi:hypothetical protein
LYLGSRGDVYYLNMQETEQVSPLRLRVGVFFIFLWWVPFWAAAPAIAKYFGIDNTGAVTFIIMAIQTIIGGIGIFIAGKQVSGIIKKLPFKKVPGTIWHVLIHGKMA